MASEIPSSLRERGRALWEKMGLEINTPEGVLGEEACRVADRIDQLFQMMDGGDDEAIIREVSFKMEDYFPQEGGDVHLYLKLTNLQNEMRQQQALLRQLALAAVGLKRYLSPEAAAEEASLEADSDPAKAGRPKDSDTSTLSEFTQRRRKRSA